MKNIVTIIGVLIGTLIVGQGVAQSTEEVCKEKIQALRFMEGDWAGSGWVMTQEAGRVEFTQKEKITFALNGSLLQIAGQGWNPEGKMIHNAYAVISYDPIANEYAMHSFLENGRQTKAQFEPQGDGEIKWWFSPNPGQPTIIEYTINISEDTWVEKGRYSPDGTQWFPFIEFTLTKD